MFEVFSDQDSQCPKCDYGAFDQNRAAILTEDIAHSRQTVAQASTQFYQLLDKAKRENYGKLRLIVGGGKIKQEIGDLLDSEIWRGNIKRYQLDNPNTGAYLVKLV